MSPRAGLPIWERRIGAAELGPGIPVMARLSRRSETATARHYTDVKI